MKFWVSSDTYSSLENDMDHAHVFYRSRTMALPLEKDLVLLFPCIARNLDIRSCGGVLSYMWYKKNLSFLFSLILVKLKC
jgi:hypothetical protein